MRVLGGLGLALFVSAAAFGQGYHGFFNSQPRLQGGFGNVVYPGGTPANSPGVQRFAPNVAFPGGGGPRLNVPLSNQNVVLPSFSVANLGPAVGQRRGSRRPTNGYFGGVYGVPVYVGGGYGGYYGNGYDNPYSGYPADAGPAPQQPPNVIVVYPQGPPQSAGFAPEPPQAGLTQPYVEPTGPAEPAHYLIAFKDHTIYSAVAYWVDGDTLHYFTSGSTHNQVSLSLIDRDLTERLNREAGTDLRLPR
ncbi:MAG TPA: hypothetical protein VLY24_31535 [Bryobacteraceae bacterium]|nr:hypothetical protein [Bryobacteraceae bacterium]